MWQVVCKSARSIMRRKSTANSTVVKSFGTGEAAESIFCDWARLGDWLPRKQLPDFFIDYLVEIVRNGEPTGRLFAAQVKGVCVGKDSALPRKLSFKGKHVRYWLRDCLHPVFVFLIDTQSRSGFWLFVQKYAKERISSAALIRQKSFTLCFASENNLASRDKFESVLHEAERYVRDLHPGSVEAALVMKRLELESTEPRFDYRILASEGRQTILVSPKVPVSLKIEFENDQSGETLSACVQAIENGSELKIPLNKLRITGSPLFEEYGRANGRLMMQFGQKAPGQLLLSRAGAMQRSTLSIDGIYTMGTKVANFCSTNPDLPLGVKCKLGPGPEPENMNMELEFISAVKRWQGLPILQLPYFEPLLDVLDAIIDESGVQTEFLVRGVPLAGSYNKDFRHPDMIRLHNFISWLGKCRTVARHFDVNPSVPEIGTITTDQWEVVEDLAALLAGYKRTVFMPGLIARCTLPATPENEMKSGMHGCIRFENDNPGFSLFGIPLTSPPINLTFTNVNVVPLIGGREGYRVLEIKGTGSTHKIIEEFSIKSE
jgi:hypothetical protein